ncbi:MAG: hydantoinase B/oxoprolinase family protein [Ardenticatenaceae bacterium]|nr:hydantoinase B/oxoprolinase family protein [Ardenticatenaceae bacterium]
MSDTPTTGEIDPIGLEIMWQRLIAIMDEIDDAIVRTSFSTIVGESRDFAYILTDEKGSSLCQSSFSPANFCVVLPRTARVLLQHFPVETLGPGDVLATNDAWIGTGHLPDYVMISPVFRKGKVVGFIGSIAHVSDVGGHPGDIEAYDVFQEGLRLPPCKLYEAGKPNEVVFTIIGNNCRVPHMVLGDLHAMIGTHRIGAAQLQEFLDDYGMDDLRVLAAEIHGRSEELMRQKIAALPDGVYEFGLDIDGYIDIVHLHATIEIRGSDVYVDYTGSSPQTRKGSINCVYNTTYASTIYPFKCALVPRIPNNEGLFRPLHVYAPEGSILNTTFPHPVKTRAKLTNNMNQVLFGVLWPILGAHAQAGSGSIWPFTLRGEDEGYGKFVVDMLPHGGRGAMRELDGLVPVAFPHNSTVTPCEVMETQAPLLFGRKELLPDSAGAGRRRGGVSQIITFRHIGQKEMILSLIPDKIVCQPPGLNGGQPGKLGEVYLNGQKLTRFPPIHFRPGDELEMRMPGGAGFGPAPERERERILHDLEMGYITLRGAREDYGLETDIVE